MWEHYSRKTLDPTQRLTVEVMMAVAGDGRWAAATTGREMPRQNGKGDEIEVVEFWGLVQRSEAILHTIHDAVMLATQAQQRMLSLFESDLRSRIKRKWLGTGQQMIELRNGGTIWYRTRTGGGGRGVDDVDRLVIDEAQHATEEHLSAVSPTLLANSNPQLNAMGTSALPGRSDWWWSTRIRALGDDPGAFGYVGHSAESVRLGERGEVIQDPVDATDRSLWYIANPVLHRPNTDKMPFLEEQFRVLGEDAFAREHLGVWAPPESHQSDPKIPADRWASTVAVPVDAEPGRVSLAFDVSKDGGHASIAVAAGDLSDPYVELIDHREGVGWLPDRIVELVQRWDPIAVGCNGAGPAGAQVGPVSFALQQAGVSVDVLTQMDGRAYKAACGGFFSDVMEGRLRRPGGQGPLDLAAADAAERPLGDAWAWDRRSATVPISPLVAVTIARALLPVEVKTAPVVFAY